MGVIDKRMGTGENGGKGVVASHQLWVGWSGHHYKSTKHCASKHKSPPSNHTTPTINLNPPNTK